MIEDIKKEIEQLHIWHYDKNDNRILCIPEIVKYIEYDEVLEILDKYKDIDKYKNAWEELKKLDMGEEKPIFGEIWEDEFKEIEQKHNIGNEE